MSNDTLNSTNTSSTLDIVASELDKEGIDKAQQAYFLDKINQKVNILFVGPTGVGKSSTINAIFDKTKARVGYGVNPETSSIEQYEFGNIVLWDSPGLGDSPENDKKYIDQIVNKLKEKDKKGNLLIDLVVLIVDASSKDMGTTFKIIDQIIVNIESRNNVGIKNLVVALNKCDRANDGRGWDTNANRPNEELKKLLDEKAESVKNRIYKAMQINREPICYSVVSENKTYNVSKLLYAMMMQIPEEKRFILGNYLNKKISLDKHDNQKNYNAEIQKEATFSLMAGLKGAVEGAAHGAKIGRFIPKIGPIAGAAIGAIFGFLDNAYDVKNTKDS